MEPEQLDPKNCGVLLKHLDKQNESLMGSYRLMFQELQKLQVEEEMLMRKLCQVMSAHDNTEKVRSFQHKDSSDGSNSSALNPSCESH